MATLTPEAIVVLIEVAEATLEVVVITRLQAILPDRAVLEAVVVAPDHLEVQEVPQAAAVQEEKRIKS